MAGPPTRQRRAEPGAFDRVFGTLAVLLLVFVGLPLVLLFPEVSWESLRTQIAERGLPRATAVSLASACLATALAAALGVPAGRSLSRARPRVAWPVRGVVLLPTVLPPVAAGVLLLNVFGPDGPVGALLAGSGARFTNAFLGIVVAQLFVAAPFVVLTSEAAFRSVDPRLAEAAETLGQGPARTFRHVVLPLAAPGILAGIALGWMRAFGEFGATVVMAYHPRTLPVHLYVELTGHGLRAALPVVLVALGVAASGLVLAARLGRHRPRARRAEMRGPARPAVLPPPSPASRRETASDGPGLALDVERRIGSFHLRAALEAGPEIVSLFGPSGAGKTTLLRLIAGLETPDRGFVRIGGVDCHPGSDRPLPPRARSVGMVFQSPSLFPHMSVEQNVRFALGSQAADANRSVADVLAVTRLEGLEGRRPDELSGGQLQRAALARALVRRPRTLLLDEPFSSLDFNMRERLHEDVRRIQRTYGLCVVYVSHDLRDACALGDRLVVMADGRLLQDGPPLEVLRRPVSFDVARFVAVRNLLPCRVTTVRNDGLLLSCGVLRLAAGPHAALAAGDAVVACFRPEDVVFLKRDRPVRPPSDENLLEGVVVDERLLGASYSVRLCVPAPGADGARELEVELPARSHEALGVRVGDRWRVSIRSSAIRVVPAPVTLPRLASSR